MKLSKVSLVAVLALGGLLACATVASAEDTNATPKPARKGPPSVEQQVDHLKTALELKDDQVPKVKQALEAFGKAMAEARTATPEERREKMKAAREEEAKAMKAALTSEQFEKWQSMGPAGGKKGKGGEKSGKKGGEGASKS